MCDWTQKMLNKIIALSIHENAKSIEVLLMYQRIATYVKSQDKIFPDGAH